MDGRALRDGILWRVRGLWRDARVAMAMLLRPRHLLPVVARFGRSPARNGPWYLQRFGDEVLADALAAARAAGTPAFVAYGTLLGALREGGFIAHDDDIDLGMTDEAWARRDAWLAAMSKRGYRTKRVADFQVKASSARRALVEVDIFRFQAEGDALVARAKSKQGIHAYAFPPALVVPLRRGALAQAPDAWLPADAEAFLAHHYGMDWRTPDASWDYRKDAASANP